MAKVYYNQIGGEYVPSSSGDTTEIRNPANIDDVLALYLPRLLKMCEPLSLPPTTLLESGLA